MSDAIHLDTCPYCGGPGEIVSLLKRKHDFVDPDEWELETSYDRKFQARCGGDKCPVQFKWCDSFRSIDAVLDLSPEKPVISHKTISRSGSKYTYFVVFIKSPQTETKGEAK